MRYILIHHGSTSVTQYDHLWCTSRISRLIKIERHDSFPSSLIAMKTLLNRFSLLARHRARHCTPDETTRSTTWLQGLPRRQLSPVTQKSPLLPASLPPLPSETEILTTETIRSSHGLRCRETGMRRLSAVLISCGR